MKRALSILCPLLVSFEAQAISRYNSTSMSCDEVRATIAGDGEAITRYLSRRDPSLQLYGRYVRNRLFCNTIRCTADRFKAWPALRLFSQGHKVCELACPPMTKRPLLTKALPRQLSSPIAGRRLISLVGRYFLTERIANLESRIASRDEEITALKGQGFILPSSNLYSASG
ncbi:hypothetical protein NKH36_02670 [Mesorhizobium sp. M1312]|uniref:hypothetical protein n=1 Tax=unclassified Mesorhizobium TaxID=325217 RepID=UPI00333C6F6E